MKSKSDNNLKAFLALVSAGLWDKEVHLSQYGRIEFPAIAKMSDEQSVVGLVTAGLDKVTDVKVPQAVLLQFIGSTLQIEQRNKDMNQFLAETVEKMRRASIYGLLVKGSGLAQCYEKPLWRSCGDIDFFFSKDEYPKAVNFFTSLSGGNVVQNAQYTKSFGVVIEPWFIELHGTMRNGLSSRMDREIDAVQRDLFYGGNVRSWQNGRTQIFLPNANNDAFLVFVHFVRHFYQNEFVLRQICDWCRLLWTYRDKIDAKLLESRLQRAGLLNEWRAFAAVAVKYLGMQEEAIPLHSKEKKWSKKADKIINLVMGGNYGKTRYILKLAMIFPWNTMKFLPGILFFVNGLKIKERVFGE